VPYPVLPGRPVFVRNYVQIENEIQMVQATVGYQTICTTVLRGRCTVTTLENMKTYLLVLAKNKYQLTL